MIYFKFTPRFIRCPRWTWLGPSVSRTKSPPRFLPSWRNDPWQCTAVVNLGSTFSTDEVMETSANEAEIEAEKEKRKERPRMICWTNPSSWSPEGRHWRRELLRWLIVAWLSQCRVSCNDSQQYGQVSREINVKTRFKLTSKHKNLLITNKYCDFNPIKSNEFPCNKQDV